MAGNKTRKLAPVFDALRTRGIRQVLTTGTAGSHHVLAMGLFSRAEDISVQAILFPQVHNSHTERVLRVISTLPIELFPCHSSYQALRHGLQLLSANTAWLDLVRWAGRAHADTWMVSANGKRNARHWI